MGRAVNKNAASLDPLAAELDRNGYDRVPLLLVGAFCAYVITWFLQLGGRVGFLGAIRFEFLLGILLIALALAVKRQQLKVKAGLAGYLIWFFLALVTQIPFSFNVDYSWTIFVDRVVKFACMTFFIVMYVRSPMAMRLFIAAFMLAWFKMGQEGFVGQITGSLVWQNQGVMRLHGSTPMYAHPNSFSGFGLGILPFAYYLMPVANRWQKIFLLVMMAFAVNIILFTGSRTGYIGFILFVAYVIYRSKYRMKVLFTTVALGIVALPLIPDQYKARFESITGNEAEGQSKVRRLEIWSDALQIFAEHPFGVGISAFTTVREQRFGRIQDTHNLYLEVATNLGIQGFIIWVVLLVAMFKAIRRISAFLEAQLKKLETRLTPEGTAGPLLTKHMADLNLMLAMLYAARAYIVVRLVVGFFGMDLYEIYWWFAMGIIIAVHNMSQVAERLTELHLGHREEPAPSQGANLSGTLRKLPAG
jgi:putative inorganic carbon (hco3(-)) transporter